MSKLTLDNLANLQNENTAVSTINDNNDTLVAAFDNTLSRDGSVPNQMESNLDMNDWHILNLPEPSSDNDPIRLIDLTNVSQVTNVLHTSSSTSNTIGTGNKTFTVPSGLGFFPGQYLIVQDAVSTANYMIGRVVSYSGTSLVFNSTVTAGSGTKSNWTIDISGAPGPTSTLYDTVSNAIGLSIPATQSFLALSGYTTVGDGGNGLYKRQVSMPTHQGRFQSADGAWWELISQDVTPEMFNCKGDAVTDDRANFQNCIDFVNLRGGGNILLTPNKIYRILLSGSTSLNNKSGVNIYFRGSTISMEQNGGTYGFRMNSNTRLIGPGSLLSPVSAAVGGSQSIYHSTISFGEPNGAEGSVGSPSALTTISNIVIDGLTITNARNTGSAEGSIVQGNGGVHDITIQNCNFPDNSTTSIAIGFDWGFYGTILSGNIAQSRINYDGGTAFSIHPHNIHILNNQIGNMTNTSSFAVRTSGCYNVTILGNDIQSTTGVGIQITGGDESFEFAPTEVRLNACRDMVIESNNIHNFKGGYGMTWDAYPDNVYDAVNNPANPSFPYASIGLTDGYNNNGRIVGNKFQTFSTVGVNAGIFIAFTRGLLIADNIIGGGNFSQYGVRLTNGCNNVTIEHNDISLFQTAGVFVGDTTLQPVHTIIKKNNVYRCGNTGASNGNIVIDSGQSGLVEENIIGITGEDMAVNGVRVNTSSNATTVSNNVVVDVRAGGTAFSNNYGSNNTGMWEFKGNRYFGSQTYVSGTTIVPYLREYSIAVPNTLITHATALRAALTGGVTPTYGTWGLGSTVRAADATSGQAYFIKCTATGTPGTWATISSVP